jgi:glucokinase
VLGDDRPIVVLDVGGTTLTAAVVVGDAVVDAPVRDSSRQGADTASILDGFATAISDAAAGSGATLTVVAMPAPFDYERGVSHMTHKFAALDGVHVGAELAARTGTEVAFINDAQSAALGVWIELGRPRAPVAVVTLGTGIGSGLVVDGEPVGHDALWTQPYLDGIVEDYVSSEALRGGFHHRSGRRAGVAEIAAMAAVGDNLACETFATYGAHLGASVAPYFAEAAVESIAVSGGITGAWEFIEPAATAAHRAAGGTAELVRSLLEYPALLGGAEFGRRGGAPDAGS